jgi:hypothetical protein
MKRLTGSVLLACVLSLLLGSTALGAGKPIKAPVVYPPEGFDFPAGLFTGCDFPIHIDFLTNTEFSITFPADDNGDVRQNIAGQLIIRITNQIGGIWVDEKISGPGVLTFHPDGSLTEVFLGRSMPLQPGAPLRVTSGRVVQEYAADGSSTLGPIHGRTFDVCAAIS